MGLAMTVMMIRIREARESRPTTTSEAEGQLAPDSHRIMKSVHSDLVPLSVVLDSPMVRLWELWYNPYYG